MPKYHSPPDPPDPDPFRTFRAVLDGQRARLQSAAERPFRRTTRTSRVAVAVGGIAFSAAGILLGAAAVAVARRGGGAPVLIAVVVAGLWTAVILIGGPVVLCRISSHSRATSNYRNRPKGRAR